VSAAKGKVVTTADFPAILADIRREGAREMGADFDHPRSSGRAGKPSSTTSALGK
jgi:hypothetical protein